MDELQAIIDELKTGSHSLADAKDTRWLAIILGNYTGSSSDANVLLKYLQENR